MRDFENTPPTVTPEIKCENCFKMVAGDKKFCPTCSFPVGGSDDDRLRFRANLANHQAMIKKAEEKVGTARTMIYVLAGIFFLAGIYQWMANDNFELMIINLIVCLLYLVFASWSNSNPFGAILTAFLVYITVHVINAFENPASIGSGIILKVLSITLFVKGIQSAMEARNSMKELEKYKPGTRGEH